ncbi:Concanavalin A-like lectin/glucanases superfamily [uncultured Caudovirales phage]|uniref:Concanavalin A-like lectin/glucanases superfamily n=1 Tax=uncultured Caudovirales phage TaxID=2100421 RepID=A0A6J5T2Q2_9CAUD|nr:Concanavalin A-like lectin/glucanases superfamily [uncultured Caudovirales phage]
MSKRYPGGIISGSNYNPTNINGSGFWTLSQQMQNKQAGVWPGPGQLSIDYIIVGGGGGGGTGDAAPAWQGGGGGAGGVVVKTRFITSTGSYTVIIGAGGPAIVLNSGNSTAALSTGLSSTFNGFTALGGGQGGGSYTTGTGVPQALLAGGSGGGMSGIGAGAANQPSSASGGLGFAGGAGGAATYSSGGGGAGGVGGLGITTASGQGGVGYTWFDGNTYASGGGGGAAGATVTNGLGGGQSGTLAFNGSNYLSATKAGGWLSGDHTVEAWIYITTLPDPTDANQYIRAACIAGEGNGTGTGTWEFWIQPNSIAVGYKLVSTITFIGGTFTFSTLTWYHVAFSRSGTTVRVFVNGVQVGSGTISGWTAQTVLNIGRNGVSSFYYPFYGYISNFRIVNGIAVYTGNFTPPAGPLTAVQAANPFGGSNVAAVTSGTTSVLLTVLSSAAAFTDTGAVGYTITNVNSVTYSTLSPITAAGVGVGGGGRGGSVLNAVAATNGIANSGGGGGGSYYDNVPGAGGSGLVVVRYPGSAVAATGGNISISGGYVYHAFTTSAAFVV